MLGRQDHLHPKLGSGAVEAIRVQQVTRTTAITAAINELRALLVTAPTNLRDQLRHHTTTALITACARPRSGSELAAPRTGHQARVASPGPPLPAAHRPGLPGLPPDCSPGVVSGVETAAQLLTTMGDNPDRARSDRARARAYVT